MKVIKVIVDELPDGCRDCILCTNEYAVCQATKKDVWYTSGDGKEDLLFASRPEWCPLVSTSDLTVAEDGDGWIIESPDSHWRDV